MAQDDWAVVLGISHYPGLTPLAGPENDALAMADWLAAEGGGDVPQPNIKVILSSDFADTDDPIEAQPALEQFRKAIDHIHGIGDANGQHVGRRLYLYLAGHGFAADINDASLIMANSVPKRPYHVSGPPYADWFRASAFFDEVVLIMDSCRTQTSRVAPEPCHLPTLNHGPGGGRRYYAFATKWDALSREGPDDGGTIRGFFTRALIEALQRATNPVGDITGDQVARYVKNWMITNGPDIQQPVDFLFDVNDDLTFSKVTAPSVNIRVDLRSRPAGATAVLLLGGTTDVGPHSTFGSTWLWLVPPGLYKVVSGDVSALIDATAGEGPFDVTL